ncbi:MAG TPA: type II toxin-antitoxin system prevent-host-death family antitoxin [Oceanospirillaceae bacterium]|nr:type II toxin-antitoxin system prevent-host-death family antitoxin [Oceanospirillaceae bacterium]
MKNARLVHEEIGVYDAKTKLAELLRRVEAGESFTITNRGNPVADIIPSRTRNESKTKKTIKAMLAARVSPISDEYLAELKNVGRK